MEKEVHIECVGSEELLEHPINSILKNLEVCIYGIGEGLRLDIKSLKVFTVGMEGLTTVKLA